MQRSQGVARKKKQAGHMGIKSLQESYGHALNFWKTPKGPEGQLLKNWCNAQFSPGGHKCKVRSTFSEKFMFPLPQITQRSPILEKNSFCGFQDKEVSISWQFTVHLSFFLSAFFIAFVRLQNTLVLIFLPLTDASCVTDDVWTFWHHILHHELSLNLLWQVNKQSLNAILAWAMHFRT